MYHVELRQFPHNFCQFNLSEAELRALILDAWARGEWVEFGERKWSPEQAKLTVIDGPEIPVDQLSMGRGWSSARRHGHDVTEQMLTAAREAGPPAQAQGAPGAADSGAQHAADSIGLEVLSRLAREPAPVALAWRLACERYPQESASDCLRLAEGAIRSLVQGGLIVVSAGGEEGSVQPYEPGAELDGVLRSIDSWRETAGGEGVRMRRA